MEKIKYWILFGNLIFLSVSVIMIGFKISNSTIPALNNISEIFYKKSPSVTLSAIHLLHYFLPPMFLSMNFLSNNYPIHVMESMVTDSINSKFLIPCILLPLIIITFLVFFIFIPCALVTSFKRQKSPSWMLQYLSATLYLSAILLISSIVLITVDFGIQFSLQTSLSHVFGKECPMNKTNNTLCHDKMFESYCYDCMDLAPLHCCGIKGYEVFLEHKTTDYWSRNERNNLKTKEYTLPISCCKNYKKLEATGGKCTISSEVIESDDEELIGKTLFTEGCYPKLLEPFKDIGEPGHFAWMVFKTEFLLLCIILIFVFGIFESTWVQMQRRFYKNQRLSYRPENEILNQQS